MELCWIRKQIESLCPFVSENYFVRSSADSLMQLDIMFEFEFCNGKLFSFYF